MGIVIGIDLGTTFSAVARLDETGRPTIIHNSDGSNITPSVVSINGGNAVVGEVARKELFLNDNTYGRFKRRMGTDVLFGKGHTQYTPTILSSFVLKKLKDEVEAQFGPVDEAVVTIPANFANEAREATLEAARLAGLPIKFIINEPTAAALYYAYASGKSLSGVYAVYDLGGGTFDISIVRVTGSDIEVLSTEGVSQLGGDDFDQKIQELVAKKYQKETGALLDIEDFTKNDAESEKKSLSTRDNVRVRVNGQGGRANITILRTEFEEAISSLLAQAEMLCETAIEAADVTASEIDGVILVGGSTRVPSVRLSVEKVFGQEPISFANPDEVVALGAALYAAFKADTKSLNSVQQASVKNINLSEITSKFFGTLSIGMNTARGSEELRNTILIRKGERIPTSVTKSFYTMRDGQTAVDCRVTESNSPETDPRFVRIIFDGELALPPNRPKEQEIRVTYSYDVNQTMHCVFEDVSSGQKSEIDLNMSRDGSGGVNVQKFLVE